MNHFDAGNEILLQLALKLRRKVGVQKDTSLPAETATALSIIYNLYERKKSYRPCLFQNGF